MHRSVVSAISGIAASAVACFAIGADGSRHGLRNLLLNIFMMPGGASLNLSHGGASPLFKHFLGGGGPGLAAIQMTLVSFIVWAILIGALVFSLLWARATRMT
jgi:hypothetical protein